MAGNKQLTQQLRQEQTRRELLDVTAPIRGRMLGNMRDAIKSIALSDPDMWPWVKTGLGTAMDQTWVDLECEIERGLQAAVLRQEIDQDAKGPDGGVFFLWLRFRRFFLQHYLPYDRTLFGKLNDPVYVVLYVATLLPVHGLRVAIFAVLLLCLAFPGPPDEYQLINYILLFKGMQFITSGLIQTCSGAVKYFSCYSFCRDTLVDCIDRHGPGAHDGTGLMVDYIGNIMLVWIAFSLLPYSRRCSGLRASSSSSCADAASADEASRKDREAGGRLRHLLIYDIRCFGVSLLLLLVLTLHTCWTSPSFRLTLGSQMSANIFWCCVFYSLLSMPFAIFEVPVLQTLLTHCDPTGFNEHGACVAFHVASTRAEIPSGGGLGGLGAAKHINTVVTAATRVVKILERGRRRGGGNRPEGNYTRADFLRGLLPRSNYIAAVAPAEAQNGTAPEPFRVGLTCGLLRSWMLPSGPSPPAAASIEAFLEESQLHLGVTSVKILPEVRQDASGSHLFQIEVIPECSLDGATELEAWVVKKTYNDFCRLRQELGAPAFTEAPFPRRHVRKCEGQKLEVRRQELLRWIQSVLADIPVHMDWRAPFRRFVEIDDVQAEHCTRPATSSSSSELLRAGTAQSPVEPELCAEAVGYPQRHQARRGSWPRGTLMPSRWRTRNVALDENGGAVPPSEEAPREAPLPEASSGNAQSEDLPAV